MASVIKIKRRAAGGSAGAPSSLASGEMAFNEEDDKLYYGKGDSGGTETSIIAIAGPGTFADLSSAQTIGGKKTFSTVPASSQDASAGSDLVRKSQMDTALAAKAPLASPTFTGTPVAPTATAGTNTTQVATTAFVTTAVSNLVASAPGALDTLDELAAALGDDANFATTMTNALAAKAPLASPALTGTPTAPTAAGGTNTTQVATTAFVATAVSVIDGGTF